MFGLIDDVNKKMSPGNENPGKVADIVEKSLEYSKQQKGKGLKILKPQKKLKDRQ